MVRNSLLVIALFLCFPATVLADAADDDTFHVFTCSDVCAGVADCGAECIPDDCYAYCSEHASQGIVDCAQILGCESFVTCICGFAEDDDEVDQTDASNGDGATGCAVSNDKPNLALPIIMAALGLIALAIGARKSRSRSGR